MVTEDRERRRWPEALIWRILEAIPYDGWVSAAEIAAMVGVSSEKVGHIIAQRLLHEYVERGALHPSRPVPFVYRRLKRVGRERER